MKMTGHLLHHSTLVITILLLVLFGAAPAFSGLFSYTPPSSEKKVNVNQDLQASPQDQVAEPVSSSAINSANSVEFTGFNEDIPGIGAFFNEMLDTLIGLTTHSERRFQTLAEHFPLIFDDLYKVFITL